MPKYRFTRGPCQAAQVLIRGRKVWGVRCGIETVGIAYGGHGDAELWARSLPLLSSLKHLTAIVRMHEGELRASERAKLAAAEALVNELNGGH